MTKIDIEKLKQHAEDVRKELQPKLDEMREHAQKVAEDIQKSLGLDPNDGDDQE